MTELLGEPVSGFFAVLERFVQSCHESPAGQSRLTQTYPSRYPAKRALPSESRELTYSSFSFPSFSTPAATECPVSSLNPCQGSSF